LTEIETDYAQLVAAKRFETAAQTLDELLRVLTAPKAQ